MKRFSTAALISASVFVLSSPATVADERAVELADGCTNCLACIDVCPSGSLAAGWKVRQEEDHHE